MRPFLRIGLAGVVLSGCAAGEPDEVHVDQALSSDATNGGTPGFFFLAPLGTPPATFPGAFDGSLKPRLRITIHDTDCNNQGTVGAIVQTYNTVFVYPNVEQYKVNHNVSGAIYVSGQCYRVIPRLDGAPLGFADVQALPNTKTTEAAPGYVKWGIGANRPIVFRLEDMDPDGDGVPSNIDNCPTIANADQTDTDNDGIGDVCDDADGDGDGVIDVEDNCPLDANPGQEDGDGDGIGDVCDSCPVDAANDADGDGVCESVDNCPVDANPGQEDADGDGFGDVCDVCPVDAANDADGDGVCEVTDNCDDVFNPGQEDSDNDGIGDACDTNCAAVAGAIGHWSGDGTFADGIGGADGVVSGSAGFGAGRFDQAFAFSGQGFVRADGFDHAGAFSVSFWAKADALQAVNIGLLSSSQDNLATSDSFQVDWNSSKGYRLKVGGSTAPNLTVNIGAASTTQFQHIAVTYDGASAIAVYLDGAFAGGGVWAGPQLQFSALKLGTNRAENLLYRGSLDDVVVFDRALAAGEVADIFAQPGGICP